MSTVSYGTVCSDACHRGHYYKDVIAIQDFYVSWHTKLAEGDVITSSIWEFDTDDGTLVVIEIEDIQTTIEERVSRIRLAQGTVGRVYGVYNTITTANGVVDRDGFTLSIYDCGDLTPWDHVNIRGTVYSSHSGSATVTVTDSFVAGVSTSSHSGSLASPLPTDFVAGQSVNRHSGYLRTPGLTDYLQSVGVSRHVGSSGLIEGTFPELSGVTTSRHVGSGFITNTPPPQAELSGTTRNRHSGSGVLTPTNELQGRSTSSYSGYIQNYWLYTPNIAASSTSSHSGSLAQPVPTSYPTGTSVSSHSGSALGELTGPPPPQPPATDMPWMGIAVDPVTWRTEFKATSNIAVVASASALHARLAEERANPYTWDRIYIANGAVIDWGGYAQRRAFFGVNRPKDDPLVIMTDPGSGGTRARLYNVFIEHWDGDPYLSGIAFVDLDMTLRDADSNRDGGVDTVAIRTREGGANILFENCDVAFDASGGKTAGNWDPNKCCFNFCIRFCRMFGHGWEDNPGHSHAAYMNNIEIKADFNFIWHNGWPRWKLDGTPVTRSNLTGVNYGGPDQYKHNIYQQKRFPENPAVWRFNYIAEASSHGIHCRSGGCVHDNIFSANGIQLQMGYSGDGKDALGRSSGLVANYPTSFGQGVHHNYFVDGEDINKLDGAIRGFGIWLDQVQDLEIHHNYFGFNRSQSTTNSSVIWHANANYPPVASVHCHHNYSYNWQKGVGYQPGTPLPLGWTAHDNHWDDPAIVFNDPDRMWEYSYDVVTPVLYNTGITKAWMDAALADLADAMTIQ